MNLILGKTGMLGSMVAKVFDDTAMATDRTTFNASSPDLVMLAQADRVINCIGVIKPYCEDVLNAVIVNSVFPNVLPQGSIQIATDCVYSGIDGKYKETDPHDALDVYGKTKSLGEAKHISNLRCSIIGPEEKNHISLLDWFLAQKEAKGFTNHYWNGITTLAFAKIVKGAIEQKIELPQLQHIVPADYVTKHELLEIMAEAFNHDIPITPTKAPMQCDRTLTTIHEGKNRQLWKAAGYPVPPTIEEMVKELAEFVK